LHLHRSSNFILYAFVQHGTIRCDTSAIIGYIWPVQPMHCARQKLLQSRLHFKDIAQPERSRAAATKHVAWPTHKRLRSSILSRRTLSSMQLRSRAVPEQRSQESTDRKNQHLDMDFDAKPVRHRGSSKSKRRQLRIAGLEVSPELVAIALGAGTRASICICHSSCLIPLVTVGRCECV